MGKKQPKKRGWRKADIEDVEEALEDERLVGKMKKAAAKGKAVDDEEDDLFTVDTAGSSEGLSRSSRREIARAKIFPPKGPNIGLTASEEGKIVKAESQLAASKRPKPQPAPEVFDLWGAPSQAASAGQSRVSRLRTPKPQNVKMPGTLHKKEGKAPAVLPAHEGQSMNPHREAYEDLACAAAEVELARERELEEDERRFRPMSAQLRDAVGAEKLAEMDEEEKMELYKSLNGKVTNAQSEAGPGEASSAIGKSKKWKQKSQAHRNKGKKRRDVDALEEQRKQQKKLEKSVGQVGTLLKELKENEEEYKGRKESRAAMLAKRDELEVKSGIVPKKRRLGSARFVEEAAVIPDTEAAAKGLRAMPLQASAVKERLASVLRRGMLPPKPEATKEQANRHKKRTNRSKNARKLISPLLKDNLLLR